MKKLTKETIDKVFEQFDHQTDVCIGIYKLVFPNWDNIEKVDGWPSISKNTNEYIMRKFISFDRIHHPDVIKGGIWLNYGFSSLNNNVPDWMVDDENVNIILKK